MHFQYHLFSSRTGEVISPVWTLLHLTLYQLQVRTRQLSQHTVDKRFVLFYLQLTEAETQTSLYENDRAEILHCMGMMFAVILLSGG